MDLELKKTSIAVSRMSQLDAPRWVEGMTSLPITDSDKYHFRSKSVWRTVPELGYQAESHFDYPG